MERTDALMGAKLLPRGRWCWLCHFQEELMERGRRWTGLGDPSLLSFPYQPGRRRSPTPRGPLPNRGPLVMEKNGWGSLSGPGLLCAAGCPVFWPAAPRASSPRRRSHEGQEADFPPCFWAPGQLPSSCPVAEGLWRPRPLPPSGTGLSGGVPRGALHLHGDRVGRAAPGLPQLGSVSQGPLEDHPERFPEPL